MVINKDGLITENQNTPLNENALDKEIQKDKFSNSFDVNGNNLNNMNDLNNFSTEAISTSDLSVSNELLSSTEVSVNTEIENSNELEGNTKIEKDEKETVETNCLALTVRKDYNFAIAKNTVFKTIRMSIKVAISTLVLNVIKLFF